MDETKLMFAIRVTIVVSGTILLLYGIFGQTEKTVEQNKKFEVVDRYEKCAVVRYTDPTQRWHYFLHCP
jgi:hypothetical protein